MAVDHNKKRASGDSEFHAEVDIKKKLRVDAAKSLTGLICIELCAGSANLSAALGKIGFQCVPIDHGQNKHLPKMHCIQINLADPGAFALIKTLVLETNVYYVHMAPPCGTASAARSRPVDPHLIAQGFPTPVPLRSKARPLGLDNLTDIQKYRVDQANAIYKLCAKVLSLCIERSIIVSLENPARSLFWDIPWIQYFCKHAHLESVYFHHCMMGGDRAKETRWLGTKGVFSGMSLACDNQHTHKPWSGQMVDGKPVWDTAGESEYPVVLCATVANIIKDSAVEKGFVPPADNLFGDLTQGQQRHKLQAAVGKQPRGRKLPQLVPEFLKVHEVCTDIGQSVTLHESQSVLRRFLRGEKGLKGTTKMSQIHIIGTRRDPAAFLEQAQQAGHPYDQVSAVSDEIKLALLNILNWGPAYLQLHRTRTIEGFIKLAASQEEEERVLHENLPDHLKPLLKNKRLVLFKSLLESSGFKDYQVVDEMCKGFDVVGKTKRSNLLEGRLRPATMTPDQLKATSKITRASILEANRKTSDPTLDQMVYEITQQEVKDGWLTGPYKQNQLDEMFQEGWMLVPRFGLKQSGKVRPIDDGKLTGINCALTTVEKLRIQDTDDLGALISFVASTIRQASEPLRKFTVVLATGVTMSGKVHESWGPTDQINMQGRTLDLKAAYKNLGNSSDTMWACILAVWSPALKGYELYRSEALMFGATSSVYSFNRVAKAIQHLAIRYLDVLTNQFFDDFPTVDFQQSSLGSREAFESLLKVLGWDWAVGEKAPPFSKGFTALGNNINVEEAISKGKFTIGNKESRIRNIKEIIEQAKSTRTLRASIAAELSGKLQYSTAQIMGDAAKPAIRRIRQRVDGQDKGTAVDRSMEYALDFLSEYLSLAKPRQVTVDFNDVPILVFTDGSSEGEDHLWGAVIFGCEGGPVVAAGRVPADITDFWLAEVGTQIICQVELFPVLLTKFVLKSKLKNRRVVFYIDNDPSRDGLITGSSSSPCSRAMLYQFGRYQRDDPSYNWFARVPSYSNYADDPSRGKGRQLADKLGASFFEDWKLDRNSVLELKACC